MSGDPAVEAAHRAFHPKLNYSWEDKTSGVASAREALRLIRKLLEDWPIGYAPTELELLEAIAPLVFSTEELREIAQRAKQSGEWSFATRWVDTEADR